MQRIETNVTTGETKVIDLPPEEVAALQAAALANFPNVKADFIRFVKQEAGTLTQRVLSGLESEYELAEGEAAAYKAAGYPATPIPSSVQDEIASKAAKGITVTATVACDTILAAATGWREAQSALRRNRLTTASAANVAADAATLNVVRKQWADFVAALTTALGL
jgi:hypothetical protein